MITVQFDRDVVTIKRDGEPIASMVAPSPEAFHSLLWLITGKRPMTTEERTEYLFTRWDGVLRALS